MKVKEESEKVGLKLNIQKTKIMASGPTTSWEIDGETVSDFIFLGSKITTDGDCSHEIKRRLLFGTFTFHFHPEKGRDGEGRGRLEGNFMAAVTICSDFGTQKNKV